MYAKVQNTRRKTIETGFASVDAQTDGKIAQVNLTAGTIDAFEVKRPVIGLRMSSEDARGLADRLVQAAMAAESLLQREQAARRTTAGLEMCQCTCHNDCNECSHSGDWHQHGDDPCPVHPEATMVG